MECYDADVYCQPLMRLLVGKRRWEIGVSFCNGSSQTLSLDQKAYICILSLRSHRFETCIILPVA